MKKNLFTFISLLIINFSFGQKDEPFIVTGQVKLLGSWSTGQKTEMTFKSSALDQFKMSAFQGGIGVSVVYKNTSENLGGLDISNNGDNQSIKVYEYDFDNDGDKEIILVAGEGFSKINVRVMKISKGLVKLIGNFKPQYKIVVSKNFISFPYGGMGLSEEFYFSNDAFFSLQYHDPNKQ